MKFDSLSGTCGGPAVRTCADGRERAGAEPAHYDFSISSSDTMFALRGARACSRTQLVDPCKIGNRTEPATFKGRIVMTTKTTTTTTTKTIKRKGKKQKTIKTKVITTTATTRTFAGPIEFPAPEHAECSEHRQHG